MLKEIADLTFPEDGKPSANPAKDFPIRNQDLIDLHNRIRGRMHGFVYGVDTEDSDLPYIRNQWPSDGCIPICFHGCTLGQPW